MVVEVDNEGTITSITEHQNIDNLAHVEFYPGILIPGMVNAHCHLELSYLRGAIAEATGFAGFAREIGRVRGAYSDDERIHAAAVADAEMWQEGVEAVADIANDALVMDVKRRSPIHYLTFFEHFGLNNLDITPGKQMADSEGGRLTPHSTYSVQDAPFKEICNLSGEILSLHMLESKAESELYVGCGSLAEWYGRMGWECDFIDYCTPARRVVESIANDKRLLLVHGCEATARDVEMLDAHFIEQPTWVLCPESNRYISNSKPPVDMLRRMGAAMAIGTDSLASARSLSMIDNMRLLSNDVELTELLRWATIGGAKALGLEATLGDIAVGKRPGLVIIEGADFEAMRLGNESKSRRIL